MLLSLSALRMPAIQFISETYQVRLKTLQRYAHRGTNLPHGQKQFFPVVIEATSGQANRKTSCLWPSFGHAERWKTPFQWLNEVLNFRRNHSIRGALLYCFCLPLPGKV